VVTIDTTTAASRVESSTPVPPDDAAADTRDVRETQGGRHKMEDVEEAPRPPRCLFLSSPALLRHRVAARVAAAAAGRVDGERRGRDTSGLTASDDAIISPRVRAMRDNPLD
jgi:hypothetical protein